MMRTIALSLLFLVSPLTFAKNDLNANDQDALRKTQEIMTNPAERRRVTEKDAEAKKADDQVLSMFGGNQEMSQEVYELAAEVFAQVAAEAKGDPLVMQQKMGEFQRNPSAFANSWTPTQKAKLKELADKLNRPDMKPAN